MSEIRLVQSFDLLRGVTLDALLTPTGTLDETDELATAVMVALGTDARADVSDALPDIDSDDLRGWWGDLDAELIWDGWPIGSKLWLLRRAKITDINAREGATVGRVQQYITTALTPFVTKKVCSQFTVAVTRTNTQEITAQVVMYRGPKIALDLRYVILWDDLRSA